MASIESKSGIGPTAVEPAGRPGRTLSASLEELHDAVVAADGATIEVAAEAVRELLDALRSTTTELSALREQVSRGRDERAGVETGDEAAKKRRERAEHEFVTNAAHELQTPLAAIISAVEALQTGAKDEPEELERFLGHIERESDRLAHLTRAMLVLAQAQVEEAAAIDAVGVNTVLRRVAARLQPREGVELVLDAPAGLAAEANEELLEQAVLNLAANAAKFTTEGQIVLRGSSVNDGVVIEVEDTGPGIPSKARVFERFYRGSPGEVAGFGLGLSIAQAAVRAFGAELELTDRPGGGTTARIWIPTERRTR